MIQQALDPESGPCVTMGILQPGADPGRGGVFGLGQGLEVLGRAQAEGPGDEQGAIEVVAGADEQQSGLSARDDGRLVMKGCEIHDPEEIAPDAGQPAEPGMDQRDRGQGRYGEDLAGLIPAGFSEAQIAGDFVPAYEAVNQALAQRLAAL